MIKEQTAKWDASEFLETDEDIMAYLSVALEEGDPDCITLAIGNIAKAHGMTEIARKTGVSRESLYRAFRKGGDPKLTTLIGVMKSLGMKLTATPSSATPVTADIAEA